MLLLFAWACSSTQSILLGTRNSSSNLSLPQQMFQTKTEFSYSDYFLEWNLPNVFKQKTKINGYNEGIYARNALQEERLPITEDRARKKGEVVVSWTP